MKAPHHFWTKLLAGSLLLLRAECKESVFSESAKIGIEIDHEKPKHSLSGKMTPRPHSSQRFLQTIDVDKIDQSEFNPCGSELALFGLEALDGADAQLVVDLVNNGLEFLAVYVKILFDQSEDGEYFGPSGEYTDLVLNRMDQMETFWGARQPGGFSPITLMGAHGSDLRNDDALFQLCTVFDDAGLLDISFPFDCRDWATDMESGIRRLPGGFSSPILTLIALAQFPSATLPALLPLMVGSSQSIIIGDGIIEFFEISSVDKSLGIDFIMGHEFCHILQVENNLFDPYEYSTEASPAFKERFEVMCDAVSAYYLAHPEGDDLTAEEVDRISLHARTVGDPMLEDSEGLNFHGSPGQRECAAIWGARLAKSTEDAANSIASFMDLVDEFSVVYSDIMASDASVCPGLSIDEKFSAAFSPISQITMSLVASGVFSLWITNALLFI